MEIENRAAIGFDRPAGAEGRLLLNHSDRRLLRQTMGYAVAPMIIAGAVIRAGSNDTAAGRSEGNRGHCGIDLLHRMFLLS